jgi:hypothetical protein
MIFYVLNLILGIVLTSFIPDFIRFIATRSVEQIIYLFQSGYYHLCKVSYLFLLASTVVVFIMAIRYHELDKQTIVCILSLSCFALYFFVMSLVAKPDKNKIYIFL